MFVLTSVASVSPSQSVEERASTRDKSGLAVEINAVIYYGKVETYAERACVRAGVSVCVYWWERGRERRSSLRKRERDTQRQPALARRSPPGMGSV